MKFSYLLLYAASTPLLAFAQTERAMPAGADVKAPVMPLQYHSIFVNYVPLRDVPQSPDKGWVLANRALTSQSGEPPASHDQPTAGVSQEMPMPKQHEHKGAHQ
jgi:hypothetical protein